MAGVDEAGETALVFLAGRLSHVLLKRAVLAPDEVAPIAAGRLAPAAAMLREDLVTAGVADAAQRALAQQILAEVSERFGTPLYARVDLVSDAHGGPLLLELKVIEPNLYLTLAAGATDRMVDAVRAS